MLKNVLDWAVARAREPSTYAGLSGLALALGLSDQQWQSSAVIAAGVAGVVAALLGETRTA